MVALRLVNIASSVYHGKVRQFTILHLNSLAYGQLEWRVGDYISCTHRPLPLLLAYEGLFPSGPVNPGYAFCMDLLQYNRQITRHTSSSATGLARALNDFHRHLEQVLIGLNGLPIQEGYHRTLQSAAQWFDVLCAIVEQHVRHLIENARLADEADDDPWQAAYPWMSVARKLGVELGGRRSVDSHLLSACPCCFEEQLEHVPVEKGCDIHFAVDGNFGHKHNVDAGDCPEIRAYQTKFFISDTFVEAVDLALKLAGQRKPREYKGVVPEEVVKECESSHTAGDGNRIKAAGDIHDDRGLMALVCRHDIPLYVCNITTRGEQSKYAIALIIWLMLHIPFWMTATALYDIACVTARTVALYGVLGPDIEARLLFCTAAMHSFAHMWFCQIHFAPRFKLGLGLTDGEGVERLWSRLRKLIPILRHVYRTRRILMLDIHIGWAADNLLAELSQWISRRFKSVDEKEKRARRLLNASGHTIAELRMQWRMQQSAQTSVRKKAAALMKQELHEIAALQDKVHSVKLSITRTERSIRNGANGSNRTLRAKLRELRASETRLTADAEELYATINVPSDFPSLRVYGPEFARQLVMLSDARRIVQSRVAGRLFEHERIDQATGGVGRPLAGTKEHQYLLNAMTKRTPALQNAIRRHNELLATLAGMLVDLEMEYPLPEELPTEITKLKTTHADALLEDVIAIDPERGVEPWMSDPTIREGIRLVHILDRCREEYNRLLTEEHKLFMFISRESQVVHALLDTDERELHPGPNASY
ncbi:hypothetical protein BKA62DRAFT_618111 [Auriculariales sp. MPI-PUGE-AT-0066]|nr:hypothetical protein BKA62DRAFT_618111 [Auriculariales sp. MPI-PUGE-AT-0066]